MQTVGSSNKYKWQMGKSNGKAGHSGRSIRKEDDGLEEQDKTSNLR